jgi:hypothetical protein
VRPFTRPEDIPETYWPVIVRDDISAFAPAGFHGHVGSRPRAVVQYAEGWSLAASHETLEMLANPFGDRLVRGQSVMPGQGEVDYLVEVCDPCEDPRFGYTVNGEMVSDFVVPDYFGSAGTAGAEYSFCGSVKAQHDVLMNGYLTWRDPTSDHWWQLRVFDTGKDIVDRGARDNPGTLAEW